MLVPRAKPYNNASPRAVPIVAAITPMINPSYIKIRLAELSLIPWPLRYPAGGFLEYGDSQYGGNSNDY